MRTIQIKILQFDELSEVAKETARAHYRAQAHYFWGDDALESLRKLADHFGGKLTDYGVDWYNNGRSYACFEMPEMEAPEIEAKLSALGDYNLETLRGHGSCVLTGYCADEDAIDGFRIAWHKGVRDIEALMSAAYETWIKAAHEDAEYQLLDEFVDEHLTVNKFEFNENGELYK